MTSKEIQVPDIGDFDEVPVIEILVSKGDRVEAETPLVTLESDKAAMDVPSPTAGTVKEIQVKVDDKVSEGSALVVLEVDEADGDSDTEPASESEEQANGDESDDGNGRDEADDGKQRDESAADSDDDTKRAASGDTREVTVPDIGDFSDVEVIEVLVSAGDEVAAEDSMITLESDKATMDVPAPAGGSVVEVFVKTGDRVSEGDRVLSLQGEAAADSPQPASTESTRDDSGDEQPAADGGAPRDRDAESSERPAPPSSLPSGDETHAAPPHASPSVRRFARELGVDIARVPGTGRKGRIVKQDVQTWVKQRVNQDTPAGGAGLPEMPDVDFSKFGEVETKPLSRINKRSAASLHRSWLNVPHVTQHEEADITGLEDFRQALKKEAAERGVKVTLLAFLIKACVAALQEFPRFNASLAKDGENLVLKKYFNIGVAVDTPDGLVVPVIRDADQKGIYDLANELGEVSQRARDKKLSPNDLQGACFTISSLGGIGGTAFTPIVNAPEVAILGVSRSQMKPVYEDGDFVPRLILPLALSYDHRVVDGAAGARFVVFLSRVLADPRRLLL